MFVILQINFHAVEFKEAALPHLADLVAVEEFELSGAFVVVILDGENAFSIMVAEPEYEHSVAKPLMLVACYKNDIHLQWIRENSLYNIRFGNRKGALKSIISARRLLLYNANNVNEYYVYNLDPLENKIADFETMASLNYPNAKTGKEYVLYKILNEVERHSDYDIKQIKGNKGNMPVFVEY